MDNQVTLEDKICYLFKNGYDPKKYSLSFILNDDSYKKYLGISKAPHYGNNTKLVKDILNIDCFKIFKKAIDCFNTKTNSKEIITINYYDFYKNIIWDKYPYKIKYCRPTSNTFELFPETLLVKKVNNSLNNSYSLSVEFIEYYNNIMSGKNKCPKNLLKDENMALLLNIKNNISKLETDTSFYKKLARRAKTIDYLESNPQIGSLHKLHPKIVMDMVMRMNI